MDQGRNPVLPSDICIPDAEAHVFHDRLYIYGSRDSEKDTYCSEIYQVVSTENMRNWIVHETSLNGKEVPWQIKKNAMVYPVADMDLKNPTPMFQNLIRSLPSPIRWWLKLTNKSNLNLGKWMPEPQTLFAPDCIEKNGKYYLYFCMSDNSEGVAVSESPEGPFLNPIQMPCAGIDPAVFIDEDGKGYYYWGQFRAYGVTLNEDMISFEEKKIVRNIITEEHHGFHEGSSMRKRNGIYYYVYPCIYRDNKPTSLAYATSKHPLGPFEYQGIIIDNAKCDPESWNIHGSIEEFHGQWYVFYHRSSRRTKFHRRLCVEKIEFNEDGRINEVKMTSIGIGDPFVLGEEIEGWRACEVENGAYIRDKDLVMCKGSKAVFRYISMDRTPDKITMVSTGEGSFSVLGNEQDITKADPGTYEMSIECNGDAVLHSLTIS